MMKKEESYIAFFDLDRTVLGVNTGLALGKAAYRMGLMKKRDVIRAFYMLALYKTGLLTAEKMIEGMGSWLAGLSAKTVSAMAEAAVTDYLERSVYREFRDELQMHNLNDARISFLTSAISEICIVLASRLGIGNIICTEMECPGGIYTGYPAKGYCYGAEKAKRMEEFCAKNGIPPRLTYYYADSISDLPALELAGTAICVNPDKKLRRIAVKRGWKIVRWKS
jgi:HAD superfamily hydrolase (TIGR01490 family)